MKDDHLTKTRLTVMLILLIFISGLFNAPAYAEPGDPVCRIADQEYASIEEAFDAAQNGDTITLLSDVSQGSTLLFANKEVTLDGAGYTITASGTGYNLMTVSGEDAVVTFKDITFDGNKNGRPAVIVQNRAKLTINDGTVIENCSSTSPVYEGALTLASSSGCSVTMNGGSIRNNDLRGVLSANGTRFVMNGGEIAYNTSPNNGGGIWMQDTQMVLNGGVIRGNTAPNGGGFFCQWGRVDIDGCEITENTATYDGGGFAADVIFIYVQNVNIHGNTAKRNGGGIYMSGSDWYGGSHVYLYGGTITENYAVNCGGGIHNGHRATWTGVFLYPGVELYNNNAGIGGDDMYRQSDAGNYLKFSDVPSGLILDDCDHGIDGWYNDDIGNRYNAHDLSKPIHIEEETERDSGNYFGALSFQGLKAAHKIYTVTYVDGVDGKAFDPQVYKSLAYNVDTPSFEGTPLRYGYRFTGWDPAVEPKVTKDAVYTAQWERDPDVPELKKYTITYDPNGGTINGSPDPVSSVHDYMERIRIHEAPVRTGYEFIRWQEPECRPGDTYTVTGDHTFYAVWEPEPNALTREITVIKTWVDDDDAVRPDKLVLRLKKTEAFLKEGVALRDTMRSLAGGGDNIQAFRKADKAAYDAAVSAGTTMEDMSEGGEPVFFWFENGTVFFYSAADNIYMNAVSGNVFQTMTALSDISGLAYFNTTYVTDMNRMFQDCWSLESLSALSSWDTGNVTDMTFMFGANYSGGSGTPMKINSLDGLAKWNTQKLITVNQMFKGCLLVDSADPLKDWNLANLQNASQMFNRAGLTDARALAVWDMSRVTNFNMMFANQNNTSTPASILPVFVSRSGTWNNGTYSPSTAAVTEPAPTVTKTPDAKTEYVSGSDANVTVTKNGPVWRYSFEVANDKSKWILWEEVPDLYTVSDGNTDGAGSSEAKAVRDVVSEAKLFNTYPPRYKVTYVYEGEGDLPREVLDTLPEDKGLYFDGTGITAKSPAAKSIRVGKRTYTFEGWDADRKTIKGADILFTGKWKITEDKPEPDKPEETDEPEVPAETEEEAERADVPDTGDPMALQFWNALAAISACALLILKRIKKKKN